MNEANDRHRESDRTVRMISVVMVDDPAPMFLLVGVDAPVHPHNPFGKKDKCHDSN